MEKYRVVSSTFKGSQDGLYTYEITFNRSLVHTGRFDGIANGLNEYDDNELREEIKDNFKSAIEGLWSRIFKRKK